MNLRGKSRGLKAIFFSIWLGVFVLTHTFNCLAGTFVPAQDYDQLFIGFDSQSYLPNSMISGDFNNDGTEDLALGVPRQNHPGGTADTGIVSVFLGGSNLTDLTDPAVVRQDEDISFYGGAENECAGYLLAAGDLNNDDKDDLVIVAQRTNTFNTAKIYVVYGSESLVGGLLNTVADIVIERDYAYFASIAVGDVNHDNIDDLVIADELTGLVSPGPFHTSRNSGPHGAVYVVFGSASLPATIDLETGADLIITRNAGAELFQANSLAIGDVNNDTYGDLAIGVPLDDGTGGLPPSEAGRVYVLYGQDWGVLSSINVEDHEDVTIYGGYSDDHIGGTEIVTTVPANPLAIGDINDDGIGDLIIGAPDSGHGQPSSSGWGKAEVVYGSAGLAADINLYTTCDIRITLRGSNLTFEYTGFAVSASDINCDGIKDILISTPRAYLGSASHSQDGIVDAIFGKSSHPASIYLETNADLTVAAPTPTHVLADGHMGSNFVVADLDDSDMPDLVIGAPRGYTSSRGWAAFFSDLLCKDSFVSLDGLCDGRFPCFSSIQTAINNTVSGATINVTNESFPGDIVLDNSRSFTICGGWDSTFTDDSSLTRVQGKMTISDEGLTVRNISLE